MDAEDEEFNRIEMESRIRQEYVRSMKSPQFMSISLVAYIKLSNELAMARTLIRELGDRLSRLEKPWAGLLDEEFETLVAEAGFTRSDVLMNGSCVERLVDLVETRLKEKNT